MSQTMPYSARPSVAARLAWGTALLMVAFVALEATARVEDWVRFGTPVLSWYRSQEDLIVRDSLGVHGLAGARFQKWVMNDLGMRGPPASAAASAGVRRVVTAGASETFGLYESPAEEYPRQLEDSLGPTFEVLNAALPGMSLPTVSQDVRLRLRALHPAVVTLYPTPSQYLTDRAPVAARPDSGARPAEGHAALRWTLRSADRLRDQVKGMLPEVVKTVLRRRDVRAAREAMTGAIFADVPPDRLESFEHDLRTFVGTVRSIGAVPVLATHADVFDATGAGDVALLTAWERQYPRASGEVILKFESRAAEVVRRVAADSGVVVVDVRGVMSGVGADGFADYSHFTDRGAGTVASAFAAGIKLALVGRT